MLALTWLAVISSTQAPAATIYVDGSTSLVIGEQAQITGNLFGFTAFEGFPTAVANRDYLARLVSIAPGCIRFPAPLAWYGPAEEQAAADWFGSQAARQVLEETLLFGARYPLARFLRTCRWLGAQPMLQLAGAPKWMAVDEVGIPLDFEQWAAMAAELVALAARFDPKLRLVQVWNEPNASWYKAAERFKDRELGYVGGHIELFNLTARAVKSAAGHVRVGGPVLCWPPTWPPGQKGHRPWYTWQQWTLPFLSRTRDTCDFFDFHAYDLTGDQVAVQLELIAAASKQVRGRRLPVWITESNFRLGDEYRGTPQEWRMRALPYEDFLWGLLDHTDKVEGNLVHDLHARAFALLPSADAPTPVYWLLWVFRDLRGQRLLATSSDEAVKVAAICREDLINVVVFNASDERRSVEMKVRVPAGYWTGPYVRALVPAGDGAMSSGTLPIDHQRRPGMAVCTFNLPARSTAAISLRAAAFLHPRHRVVQREYFAHELMVPINRPDVQAKFALTLPAGFQPGRARLRIGLLGAAEGMSLIVAINAKSTVLQNPRPWQELPASGLQPGNNTVVLSPSGDVPANFVAAFVSVVEQIPSPQ